MGKDAMKASQRRSAEVEHCRTMISFQPGTQICCRVATLPMPVRQQRFFQHGSKIQLVTELLFSAHFVRREPGFAGTE